MSFSMAKDILDKQLSKCDPKAPVVIEVFGGEAFANFKLIKEIEEYVAYAKRNGNDSLIYLTKDGEKQQMIEAK